MLCRFLLLLFVKFKVFSLLTWYNMVDFVIDKIKFSVMYIDLPIVQLQYLLRQKMSHATLAVHMSNTLLKHPSEPVSDPRSAFLALPLKKMMHLCSRELKSAIQQTSLKISTVNSRKYVILWYFLADRQREKKQHFSCVFSVEIKS